MCIREDPWLPSGIGFKPTWREGVQQNSAIQVVSELVRPKVRLWNDSLICRLFKEDKVEEILRMLVLNPLLDDKWIWTMERNGIFFGKIFGCG